MSHLRGNCFQINYNIRFQARKTGFDTRDDRYGLFMQINNDVQVLASKFNVEPMTLLTHIGGIIGVGKEFLWIILPINTFLITLFSRFSKFWK